MRFVYFYETIAYARRLRHELRGMLRPSSRFDTAGQSTGNGDACRNRTEQRRPEAGCDIGQSKGVVR